MTTVSLKIINEYIQMLNSGHVKVGLYEATKEQVEFSILLLQAIAADIEASEGDVLEGAARRVEREGHKGLAQTIREMS